jgi:predicted Fe-Mo cluster-binding NifX family protein
MNIIIPVIDDNEGKFKMAKGFHHTEHVCVYNTLNSSYEWFKNKDISQSEDTLSLSLKRKGIYTIITGQIPFLALRLFKESGLLVYKAKSKSLEKNIEFFLNDELESFSHQMHFGAAGSACGSCSSSSCGPNCN